MTRAIIYKPAKTVTQSGVSSCGVWVLEILPENTRFTEPLMGWSANSCMEQSQVRLKFASKDEAISYAKTVPGLEYEVLQHHYRKPTMKSYVDNFK